MSRTAKITTFVLGIVMIMAWLIESKYGVSLLEYIDYSVPLTTEERAYLKRNGTLTYGARTDAAPLSFVAEDSDRNQGIIIDYISFFADELGANIQIKSTDETSLVDEMFNYDIDITDTFATKWRNQNLDFSQSFYSMKGIIITKSQNTHITGLNSLKGKKLVVLKSDYCKEFFSAIMEIEDQLTLIKAESIPSAIEIMMAGEADAIAGDEMIVEYYVREKRLKSAIKTLNDTLYTKDICIAVRDDNDILLNIINKTILTMKRDNVLTETQQRWFGTSALNFNDTSRYIWIPVFFGLFFAFSLLLYIWDAVLRKQIRLATKEINNQRETLRTIIDSVDSALILINEDGSILESNILAEEMSHEKHRQLLRKRISDINTIGSIYNSYTINHKKLHKIKNRYYNIDVRNISGDMNTKLVLCKDTTKSILAERKLRQENKMTAIGQLSAGLAHEIRNPLGLIRNYKYVISDYATDEMSHHAVEIIGNSVDRINDLIDNLLKFSRLSNDQSAWFSINNTINNILLLEDKKADAASIDISVMVNVPDKIYSSEEIIRIALFNLINNAIEALSRYETDIQKEILVYVTKDGNNLKISVSDNGAGIKDENLENIFNPFFTTKDNGTGLGLYIVSTELEKISGSITVSSHENSETIFTVIIPAETEGE